MTNSTNYMLAKMNKNQLESSVETTEESVSESLAKVDTASSTKEFPLSNLVAECLTKKDQYGHKPQ